MKTMLQAAVVAAMLTTGAAQAADQYVTRYTLDGDGDLVAQQYLVPDNSGKVWKTVGIIALGLVGVAGAVWLVNEWTEDDDPEPVPVQPTNPLYPVGGTQTSTWSGEFVQPVYQPL